MQVIHKGKTYTVRYSMVSTNPNNPAIVGYNTTGGIFATTEVTVVEKGKEAIAPPPEPTPPSPALVNLNTATQAELTALPNVGKTTARRIAEGRPYDSVGAAQGASGLSEEKWAEVAPLVTTDG